MRAHIYIIQLVLTFLMVFVFPILLFAGSEADNQTTDEFKINSTTIITNIQLNSSLADEAGVTHE